MWSKTIESTILFCGENREVVHEDILDCALGIMDSLKIRMDLDRIRIEEREASKRDFYKRIGALPTPKEDRPPLASATKWVGSYPPRKAS